MWPRPASTPCHAVYPASLLQSLAPAELCIGMGSSSSAFHPNWRSRCYTCSGRCAVSSLDQFPKRSRTALRRTASGCSLILAISHHRLAGRSYSRSGSRSATQHTAYQLSARRPAKLPSIRSATSRFCGFPISPPTSAEMQPCSLRLLPPTQGQPHSARYIMTRSPRLANRSEGSPLPTDHLPRSGLWLASPSTLTAV